MYAVTIQLGTLFQHLTPVGLVSNIFTDRTGMAPSTQFMSPSHQPGTEVFLSSSAVSIEAIEAAALDVSHSSCFGKTCSNEVRNNEQPWRGHSEHLKRVKTVWQPGLRPRPRWGSLQHSPEPLAGGDGAGCPSPRTPPSLSALRAGRSFLRLGKKIILATALSSVPVPTKSINIAWQDGKTPRKTIAE